MKPAVSRLMALLPALVVVAIGSTAQAGDDRDRDRERENRIVGLWGSEALVGPCDPDVTPAQQIRNTLLFNAGGTFIENARVPPGGITQAAGTYWRTQGLGTWVYEPAKRRYYLNLRFDNYVNNVYNGYSIVEREITLTNHGMLASGPVRSTRYFLDGTAPIAVCGQATSTPL